MMYETYEIRHMINTVLVLVLYSTSTQTAATARQQSGKRHILVTNKYTAVVHNKVNTKYYRLQAVQ